MAAPTEPSNNGDTPAAPPTADQILLLIHHLTSPTQTDIRYAEANLLTYLTSPSVLQPLADLLSHHAPQVRHFSAILLRRALTRHYTSHPQLLQPVKARILPLLSTEVDPAARRGLIALSAYICKLEDALWPDLTTTTMQLAQSEDPVLRASAFAIFQSLCDTAADHIAPHIPHIASILSSGLTSHMSPVRLAALRAYASIANTSVLRHDIPLDTIIDLLPSVVVLTTNHPDRSSDEYARIASTVFDVLCVIFESVAMDFTTEDFPEACQRAVSFFPDACQLALQVFADEHTCLAARSAANEFLVFSLSYRPSALRADGTAQAIAQTAVSIVMADVDGASAPTTSGAYGDGDSDQDPGHLALRLLYTASRRAELSKLVFAAAMAALEAAGNGVDLPPPNAPAGLPAACRVLSAVAQGCADEITARVREIFPRLVAGAVGSSLSAVTRARALEAVGCVCDALDSVEMPDDLVAEVAHAALDAVLTGLRMPEAYVCKTSCVALEPALSLFANDANALWPRVGDVLRALGAVGADIAEEAVMAIGVLIEHAPDAFNESEMYNDVIQWILRVMSNTAEDKYLARAAATSAAGSLVANCTDQTVIERLATHAIVGLETDEPALKQATFSFFARMADELGGSVVAVFGERILQAALEAMERKTLSFGGKGDDEGEADPSLFNMGEQQEDEEENEDDGFEVHTAYLDEKMVAVATVGAFASASASDAYVERVSGAVSTASNIRSLFADSARLLDSLTTYFHEDVRSAAYHSLFRLAVANDALQRKQPALAFSSENLLQEAFVRLSLCFDSEDEVEVLTSVLNSCATLFGHISADVMIENKGGVVTWLNKLMVEKIMDQVSGEGENGAGDVDEDDELDVAGDILEGVGEVIVAMACLLRGYFAADYKTLLRVMMECVQQKRASTRSKGILLGTTAAVLLYLNWDSCTSVTTPVAGSAEHEVALSTTDETGAMLLPVASEAVRSSDSKTVRQNGMFLIGVIFAKSRGSKKEVWDLLGQALKGLEEIMRGGKSGHGALMDNAAGALARIMYAPGLPEESRASRVGMLQAALGCVPVENDPTENSTIAKAVVRMSEEKLEVVLNEQVRQKVLNCLVTACLTYVQICEKRGREWSGSVDVDACDEMGMFSEAEVKRLMVVLRKVMAAVGDEGVSKLKLSKKSEERLREALAGV